MKSYTDIEQSKKLAEILPLESADMYWFRDNIETPRIYPEDMMKNSVSVTCPCWSLAALLSVLPEGTRLLKSATDDTYHCDCPKGNIDKWFDNPIEVCYEMVLNLHEQELL